MTIGVIILTMGNRPVELNAAIESVLRQRDVVTDVVVVGNGWEPTDLPEGVHAVHLPENVGIPDGRNAGVPEVAGELLFFLDDDCELPGVDFLAQVVERFAADPKLGMLQPRISDPRGFESPRNWTPRLRVGDPGRSSPATSVAETAVMIRRGIFDAAGGWPSGFFYNHEGIDLAWRVWDADSTVWYAGDLVVHHPVVDPRRHDDEALLDARNRVWVARRNLPAPLIPCYLGTWMLITRLRRKAKSERVAWWQGYRQGWAANPGDRRPMKWRTVARMTRAGRPPVI